MKKNVVDFLDKKKIANRLKMLRNSKTTVGNLFTLKLFSQEIGISTQQISDFENGKTLPSRDALLAYSKYFNVSLEYLLGLSDVKNYTYPELGYKIGLSDKAIDILADTTKKNSELIYLINQIAEIDCGVKLLKAINEYFYSAQVQSQIEKAIKNKNNINLASQYLSNEPNIINDIMEIRLHRLLAEIKNKINNN